MKNLKNYSKGILSLITVFFISNSSFAATTESSGWSNTTMFYILLVLALLILLGILFLSNTIKELIQSDFFKDKIYEDEKTRRESKKDNSKIITTLLLLVGVPFASFSQSTGAAEASDISSNWVWTMVIVNLVLVGFLFYLKKLLSNVLDTVKLRRNKVTVTKDGKTVSVKETSKLTQILTDTVSLEDEDSILMDHEYDGIHELDNNLPPWWIWSFYASIIFAVVYLFNYHVFKTGDLQITEYEKTIVAGDAEVAKFLKEQNLNVDENTVILLTETQDIKDGKAIFNKKCIACHGKDGGGTVGPNLTDNYWIHGGKIADVFKIVKYGNPAKGMQAWKDELNPVQIQQVSSYIKSINGTVEGGKSPQGDLFSEDGSVDTNAIEKVIEEIPMEALTDKVSLAEGKKVYDLNCFACHGSQLEGTIGPNLTDNAWVYGGKTRDIYNTIANGASKGMIAWKDNLSEEQILQVTSYIESLNGSNPPNGKEPEGTVAE